MKNKSFVLLRTLLLASSSWNKARCSGDKKQRRKAVGNIIGLWVLYLMVMGYSVLSCVGYGYLGMVEIIPVLSALTVSLIAFIFTLLKTNGYLFNFKEYDMLMSLPFTPKTVAGVKFAYMYLKTLPWLMSVSLATLLGYGIYARPVLWVYPVWVVLAAVLPVIPMLAAAFLGYLIAKISAGFRKTNLVQTVLLFAVVLFCFGLRFILPEILGSGAGEAALEDLGAALTAATGVYLPAKWFAGAVTELRLKDTLLLLFTSALLFEAVFLPVGRSYRRINSALAAHAGVKAVKVEDGRRRSVVNAIAFKEMRRMLGSTAYMVNIGMGEVLSVLLGVTVLAVGMDKVIGIVTQGAPVTAEMLYPAIPLLVYFFIGMVPSTAVSPSLEGKNYWILQSMPVDKKQVYRGKMLFNLYLTVPCSLFATVCFCISAGVPFTNALLYCAESLALCAFSTAWGCVCGLRFMKLDWENETEVVKQGTAVAVYLFPNMLVTMGLVVLVVVLGRKTDGTLLSLLLLGAAGVLAGLSYLRSMKLAVQKG